jgi:hypothetical protein
MTLEERIAEDFYIEFNTTCEADVDYEGRELPTAVAMWVQKWIDKDREAIARFLETHTVAYSAAKIVETCTRLPSGSQIALAEAVRSGRASKAEDAMGYRHWWKKDVGRPFRWE